MTTLELAQRIQAASKIARAGKTPQEVEALMRAELEKLPRKDTLTLALPPAPASTPE